MKKLLITGFDPFAHYYTNPSWEVAKALPEQIRDWQLYKQMLPNIYALETRLTLERAEEIQPDAILLMGMNSASTKVVLNFAALNIRDALVEDNLGNRPWHEKISEDGPAAYFSTMDMHKMYILLKQDNYPVTIDYSCGGYTCNDLFYGMLQHYAETSVPVGFLHIPLLPQMVYDEKMALPLSESVAVVKRLIELL